MEQLIFRRADESNIDGIMEIIGQAVRQMLDEGKHQWDETYPQRQHIAADVANGCGYVMCHDGAVAAYGAVVFSGEPAYADIDGQWLTDGAYVVLHRLAVDGGMKRQGVGTKFFDEVERLAATRGCAGFRVDTNHDNERMLGLLSKLGFTYCGIIRYEHGERLAFEKPLKMVGR